MIEILNIFFLIFSFSILLSNTSTINFIKDKINLNDLSLSNIFSINILIVMIILLITSFFEIKIIYVATLLFISSLIGLIFNKKKNLFVKKKYFISYFFFIILCFIICVDLIANPKLEWDGHGWYFHAFNFKENFNFFNLVNADRYNQPHLGGILWGIVWSISFLDYEFYGRIFYIILYLCAILSVSENVSKLLLNRIIISIVLILLTYDKFLFSGYQEVLVFSIIAIVCNLIYNLNLKKLTTFQIFFITIISSLLLWSKNDGIIFFTIIMLYLIYFQNLKNKMLFISLAFLSILLKFYLISFNDQSHFTSYYEIYQIFNFQLLFEKSIFIFIHIIVAMFKYPIWILFIFVLALNKDFKKNLDVVFFSLTSLLFIFLVYLFYDVYDYKWLIKGSLDRLIFQASGFLLIFVASSINLAFKRFNN